MARNLLGGRARRAFSCGMGLLITALGAIAILGPEAAHVFASRTVGVLLVATGALSVASLLAGAQAGSRRATWTWSLIAVGIGAGLLILPVHGLAAAGALIGMLLLGHGVAAGAVVVRGWRRPDAFVVLGSLAASFLCLVGLALLFGESLGDQAEQILIGIDMVMFGAFVTVGHELVSTPSSSGPSPGAPSS